MGQHRADTRQDTMIRSLVNKLRRRTNDSLGVQPLVSVYIEFYGWTDDRQFRTSVGWVCSDDARMTDAAMAVSEVADELDTRVLAA